MTKLAGGRPRLTRRGVVVSRIVIAAPLILACIAVGFTVDLWSPCAGDHACVVEVGRG